MRNDYEIPSRFNIFPSFRIISKNFDVMISYILLSEPNEQLKFSSFLSKLGFTCCAYYNFENVYYRPCVELTKP